MLEHSAMYLNVTPPYEDDTYDTSFFPDFYTRLGPCELQDPVWAKMSALATGVNKKRKKSETKPQAQINKCNNEKRRREQENIYIEELAELISANFADMSSLSVKPDKCAILQETVNQIRSIKQRESAAQSTDPVQQGEVSSSRPTILSNEVYGPLLLEALEGFLFVVSAEGKVEHVTENVSTYIKFTKEEVLGKSIYNIIHHGDHARFSGTLVPMTIAGWSNEQTNRSRSFNVRFLVKPPNDQDESVEEKQQRVSSYELMHISSTQLRESVSVSEDDGSDSGPCLLCVASRINHRDKSNCSIEQFTTKLDTSGKVICVDTSGVSPTISQYIKKDLKDRVLRDLVPQQEVNKINTHLKETITNGQSTSAVYRLQIGPDKFVQVQTKSKLFKTNPHATNDTDFIMATHSIIRESDGVGPSDPGGGSTSPSVGGPLMTSVVNGTTPRNCAPLGSGESTTTSNSNSFLNTNTTSFGNFSLDNNDFNFNDIFPTSTWDLESSNWAEPRPDSRQSVTPVSTPTPRPPSNPSYSPATTVAQSPLTHIVPQHSPTIPNPSTPFSSTFDFGSMAEQNYPSEEQKETKANVLEEAANTMAVSGKLRTLLSKKPNSVDSANDAENRDRDRILKELLKQQDEDGGRNENRTSPRSLIGRPGPANASGSSEHPKASSGGNSMLRDLLNDKSDDDDHETKAGMKTKSELLQQLLKSENRDSDEKKGEIASQDDTLLRSLGCYFSEQSPNGESRGKKRPSDDRDENPNKRSNENSQVSSSGPSTGSSKLCEKNKMLASLLAQPSNDQPIPHIPASVISATPQEILPRIKDASLNKNMQLGLMNQQQNMQQQQQHQNIMNNNRLNARMPGRPQNTSYLSTTLSSVNNMQRNDGHQLNQVNPNCFTSPATSSTDNNNTGWENSADPLLSDILDQVIDIVPDDSMHMLDGANGHQPNNFQKGLSEKMAINIIQNNLMQCESAVNPSPAITMPGTPPAYSSVTTSQNSHGVFSPPPVYKMVNRPPRLPQQYSGGNMAMLHQQRRQMIQQQQQQDRRRLLQQQQKQQLLIPSNATAEMNSMQNIDSLLNTTVAPNVSLQRSSSVPESQLSPNFGGQINQPNPKVNNQQQPYSPHAQLASPIGQQPGFTQTTVGNYQQPGARLSPQAQFNQQLSPRQAYPQGNAQNANWQQPQARLSVQQNPMLNAQLTGNYVSGGPNGRNFQRAPQQQQRSINSPGTVPTRNSPYPQDQFPPPSSPNSAAYSQNQYLRVQRANSAPTATTQLPGGLGSPRPYAGREHHPHSYPQISQPPPHPMLYQDQSQYSYDQTGLQYAYNGADRGRGPQHLPPGVSGSGSGPTSEFVRQELRAVVGARTGQAQPTANRGPPLLNQHQQVSDLDALGINFEMSQAGASDSPKLWGAMGSDMGSMSPQPATSRSTMEEGRAGDHKSSLLQKLLSE